jgi:hypothetical protein
LIHDLINKLIYDVSAYSLIICISLVHVQIKLLLIYIGLKYSKYRFFMYLRAYNARGPQQVLVTVSSLAGECLLSLCLTSYNFTLQWEECRQWVNLKLRDGFTGGECPPSPGQSGCRGGAIFHDKQKLLETK